jgi:signal transduction histidine kinase/DNA-binding response OmpR family regulator/HAMP domain-containing protein
MRKFFSKYLSIRISAIIIVVEVFVFTAFGLYYFKRFSMEVDKRIETQVQIPGVLMNRQLLRYESIADKDVISELVGEEFVDGLVVGADSKIYYALNDMDVIKQIEDIPWINKLGLGKKIRKTTILKDSDKKDNFLICITPLAAYGGAEPFFFSCIKVRTNHSEAKKNTIAGLFIFGSIACVMITSMIIIWLMGRIVIRPLSDLKKSATGLADGDLNRDIDTRRGDELGDLAKSFAHMRDAVRKKIDDLNLLNEELQQAKNDLELSRSSLEKKVNERTEALSRSERRLARAQIIARIGNWNWEIPSDHFTCSDETFRILGVYPHQFDMTHDAFSKVIHPDDRQMHQNAVHGALYEKEDYNIDYRIILPDGSERVVHAEGNVTFDKSQQPVRMMGIVQDITEHKQAMVKLESAIQAAEAANSAKSEFLANMSHELRTPLNAILGFSQLMRRDPDISPEQLDNLETINRSGEYLLSLINDVLDFSKIEAGKIVLNKESFDLHRLLLGLEEMFRLRARQRGLSLNFERGADIPQYIHTDQNKLRQILINLLGNAVKFTEKGKITLRVTTKEPAGPPQAGTRILKFEVIDTGFGISRKEQAMIFDAFFQANERNSSYQGTGLGLPISREFVTLMGGRMTVNSQVGTGTCFSFDIPVEFADGAETASPVKKRRIIGLEGGDQPDFRLLVVEDNDNNRTLLVKLLQSVGFEVQEAVNGKQAVRVWRKWKPHLIWMDMRMPVMDGYEATAVIKSEMRDAKCEIDTKIIALTASAFVEDRMRVMEHGGNDFVRKPFRTSEIFEMIEKHLGVNYLYDEDGRKATVQPTHTTMAEDDMIASITTLPGEVVGKLTEATELSDTAIIDNVIEEIRTKDAPLAGAFSELAADFAYDEILSLVQKAKG